MRIAPNLPWRDMVTDIHGAGLSWVGFGWQLGATAECMGKYAAGGPELTVTYERGVVILRLHEALLPERFAERIQPLLTKKIDTKQLLESVHT